MTELTIHDLATETAELLPTRETLDWFSPNFASVYASNSALALNAASVFSYANASALQSVIVSQH